MGLYYCARLRGAAEPVEHAFFASAEALIEKIRERHAGVPIFLMQHWVMGADREKQIIVNENYDAVATHCGLELINLGDAFLERADLGLLDHHYTPNKLGIQVAAEGVRAAIEGLRQRQ